MNAGQLIRETSLNPSFSDIIFTTNFFKRIINKNYLRLQNDCSSEQKFIYNYEKGYYSTDHYRHELANNMSIEKLDPFFEALYKIPLFDVKKEIFDQRFYVVNILLLLGACVFMGLELIIYFQHVKNRIAISISQFIIFIIYVLGMFYVKNTLIKKKLVVRQKMIKRKINQWDKILFSNFGQAMIPGQFGAWLELHVIENFYPQPPKNSSIDNTTFFPQNVTGTIEQDIWQLYNSNKVQENNDFAVLEKEYGKFKDPENSK